MGSSEKKAKSVLFCGFFKGILSNALVILAVIALVFATSVCAAGSSLVTSEAFPDGASVNGISLSGKTYDEGREIIEQSMRQRLDSLDIRLDYNGEPIALSASELGLGFDTDAVMEQLSYEGANGGFPIFKYIKAVFTKPQSDNFTVPIAYDREKVNSALAQRFAPYDTLPENAQMVFDESSAKLSYLTEKTGQKAKTDVMTELVIKYVEGSISSPIVVVYDTVEPDITQDRLMQSTALIGECVSPLPDNAEAVSNLRIACGELSGTVIKPGEILSLCGIISDPTPEGGYLSAPDVCEGEPHSDFSGGICRLSGALYNAALLTNMEIVSRSAHTYVPDYFPAGLDAVINWAGKDLKIKNVSDFDIYISAVIEDGKLAVRLFGEKLPEGLEIKAATELIRNIESDDGTEGREVAAYRNYYLNNSLADSELISRDIYEAKSSSVSAGTGTGGK